MQNLLKLNKILNLDQKKQFIFLVLLILFSMILEISLLKFVFILLNYFANPDINNQSTIFNYLNSLDLKYDFTIIVIFILLVLYVLKTSVTLLINWKKGSFIFKTKENLSQKFLKGYLFMPRIFHMRTNTAELIKNVTTEVDSVMASLLSISNITLEFILLVGLLIFLFFLNFKITIVCLLLFLILSFLITTFNSKKNILLGKQRVKFVQKRLQNIIEALTGSKTYEITGLRDKAISVFDINNIKVANISIETYFRNASPKPLIELFTIIVITIFLIILNNQDISLNFMLPTLGVFLTAAYRLIPSFSTILSSLQGYHYSIQAINNLSKDFEKFKKIDLKDGPKIIFQNQISLNNLSFSYQESSTSEKNLILDKVNLTIKKGSKIGIIGESGSGKSTFIDILMGLLTNYKGEILIDGKNVRRSFSGWQKNIGCVPQDVFILDDTLKKNIAFGLDEETINNDKIYQTLELAGLKGFVDNLPLKIETIIGEKGDRISGGQKQRVGIARALYLDPDILILDEPTSALDETTEEKIVKEIFEKNKSKTVIFVSHNQNNLNYCETIYKVDNKKLKKIK